MEIVLFGDNIEVVSRWEKILNKKYKTKIISNEDKTITVQAINEDPFGKLEEKQVFYQIEPLLFKSADKEQYIGFKKNDKGEIIYLYSGSGYHGTYKKIDKWYQNPTLHKMAYIGFITLYFLHILSNLEPIEYHKYFKYSNTKDYLYWIMALTSNQVANTPEDADKSPNIRFFIYDDKVNKKSLKYFSKMNRLRLTFIENTP